MSPAFQCKQCSSLLAQCALRQTRHDSHSDEENCCTAILFLSSNAPVWTNNIEPSHPSDRHTHTHTPSWKQTVLKLNHLVIRLKLLFGSYSVEVSAVGSVGGYGWWETNALPIKSVVCLHFSHIVFAFSMSVRFSLLWLLCNRVCS